MASTMMLRAAPTDTLARSMLSSGLPDLYRLSAVSAASAWVEEAISCCISAGRHSVSNSQVQRKGVREAKT